MQLPQPKSRQYMYDVWTFSEKQSVTIPAQPYIPVAANLQAGIHRSKMAVFDIDDTLFDASQRETNARRAGLAPSTPYTETAFGVPERKEGIHGLLQQSKAVPH